MPIQTRSMTLKNKKTENIIMEITEENKKKSIDLSDGYIVFTDKFGNIYDGEWRHHKKTW